ncbi:hypothetical protein IF1G_04326 [Cordyceps javanica]|uniref:Uncharacterized protein n=1 Tax=Cordyceps javanica TaxID=43265 RepID=A0A545W301_9HYPO|nr:hypothetical protein IF1G_04326 [Cordyceps javanica]TQW08330.1 wnt and FGF inhibitory regulator domain-containing protein [Cordyceps javanica]
MGTPTVPPATASTGAVTAATTTSDGAPTTDTVLAMTTPFSMPPECLDFNGAEIGVWDPDHVELTRSFQDHPSCWPSGLGFSMNVQTWSIDDRSSHTCSRTIKSGETSITVTNRTDGSPTIFLGSATLMIPSPMTIFWHREDASTLTPRPPDITPGSFAPSWVPGQTANLYDLIKYDDSPQSNRLATGVFAAVIAVPIVIFLAILGCCICCFRIRRRREKREIAKEQEESQALAVARTSTQERTPNRSTDAEIEAGRAQGSEPVAVAGTASSTMAGQADTTTRGAAAEPTGESSTTHALSGISKPHYPGLPSQGFDSIEEPPPYAEAPPSYATRSGPIAPSPTSLTRELTTHENANVPGA